MYGCTAYMVPICGQCLPALCTLYSLQTRAQHVAMCICAVTAVTLSAQSSPLTVSYVECQVRFEFFASWGRHKQNASVIQQSIFFYPGILEPYLCFFLPLSLHSSTFSMGPGQLREQSFFVCLRNLWQQRILANNSQIKVYLQRERLSFPGANWGLP